MLVLTGIGVAIAGLATNQYQHARTEIAEQNAMSVAEAAIEQSVYQLNSSDSFSGYASPQELFNNKTEGRGVFTATVTNLPSSNAKSIVATGTVYPYNGNRVLSKRSVRVTVVGTSSSGYSVQTGPGGLILGGSASITSSNVYVNGTISLSGASSIGTASNPVNVYAGNIACPTGSNPGSSYPQLCSGTQPITMAYSTYIYGTVCATGQTSTGPNNNIKPGSGGAGLQVGCTAPAVSPPTYDRSAQIAAVTTTKSSTDKTVDCTQWDSTNAFKRTWPANLKLTGNVNIASSCDLTITGNVYITGNLTIGGAAKITIDNSVGTTRPVIMVDGTIDAGGSGGVIANSSGTGPEFVSFSNSTGNPGATPTGTDLYNSQKKTTVTVGGAGQFAGAVFDAYWGTIVIAGSGHIGAAAGQTVNMSGAGTVIFGTELSSGSKTWGITSYQQIPNP